MFTQAVVKADFLLAHLLLCKVFLQYLVKHFAVVRTEQHVLVHYFAHCELHEVYHKELQVFVLGRHHQLLLHLHFLDIIISDGLLFSHWSIFSKVVYHSSFLLLNFFNQYQ